MTASAAIVSIEPRKEDFVNPFNHKGWLRYFSRLLPRFQYIRFLGLPHLKDRTDALLEKLYVPLSFSTKYDRGEVGKTEKKESLDQVLASSRRHILLGDPGSGKSTLTNYLVTLFSAYRKHHLIPALGQMIPLPFILRDYKITDKITFEDLLKQFHSQPFWRESGLSETDLEQVLNTGQAMFLLDGLDEVGDADKRTALRNAVMIQGMASYPTCVWLLTSRIVGYEDAPYHWDFLRHSVNLQHVMHLAGNVKSQRRSAADQILGKALNLTEKQEDPPTFLRRLIGNKPLHGTLTLRYILPFDKSQIQRFSERWYALREADASIREENVRSLIKAVNDSSTVGKLAHNPSLLTLIALIHRVHVKLPSGRALLFDKITEAYLESIDTFRGLRKKVAPMHDQRVWLSDLAYEMQLQRTTDKSKSSEILVSEKRVLKKMDDAGIQDARQQKLELEFLTYRSGLLIPRKPGFFCFVHLSFQEYFAAHKLYDRILALGGDKNDVVKEIKKFMVDANWHECLIFLFEKLAPHPGSSDWLFSQLFPERRTKFDSASVHLAAELMADLQSGIRLENREYAAEMIINRIERNFDDHLLKLVNGLPADMWAATFLPAVKKRLKQFSTQKNNRATPEFLLFCQSLYRWAAPDLEQYFSETVLSNNTTIKKEDLYYLHPTALNSTGPVRKKMIDHMPVQCWFETNIFDMYNAPIRIFSAKTPEWRPSGGSHILTWSNTVDILMGILLLKVRLMRAGLYSDHKALARALARARDLDRARALALARARDLDWDLDRALVRARARARDLDWALALALARDLDRDLALVRALDFIKKIFLNADGELPIGIQIVQYLFSGNMPKQLPFLPKKATEETPFSEIVRHLSHLVLGMGGIANWTSIQEQVDIIRKPLWIKRHIPFMSEKEMKDIFYCTGLRMKDGEGVFKTKWFEETHEMSPLLLATPKLFVAAMDNFQQHVREKSNSISN